jgi:DNA polymerase-3 subunit delta
MAIITPDSLETTLRSGRFDPVYLLFGDEEFLIDEACERLVAATVDASTREFNYDLFHGTEATLPDIVDRAMQYPMMAERRVVVVKELDRIFALRGKPEMESPFARYLRRPSETTVLIMTAATSDFLKGKTGAKAPYDIVVGNSTAVNFKKLYDREIPSWVGGRIRSRGKEITPEGVELFVGYAGGSLRVLSNEIEKLFTFVEDRSKITGDDVRAIVGANKTYNVFELQKAVGARNLELSVDIAERMLRAGESEQMILTMLTRYFTILWRLFEIRSRTKDQNEMARSVGISPFFLGEYLAALGRYPMPHLQNAFEALLATDVALKTSNLSGSTALQMLLVAIVRGDRSLVARPTDTTVVA